MRLMPTDYPAGRMVATRVVSMYQGLTSTDKSTSTAQLADQRFEHVS